MEGMHGHVVPRPDGAKARCGGPALCAQCAREKAAQEIAGYKIGDRIYHPSDVVIIRRQDEQAALADAVILERAIQVLERWQPGDSEAKAATIAWLKYNAHVLRTAPDA
jgi:hypothetical protein